jgi:hypothetical protein
MATRSDILRISQEKGYGTGVDKHLAAMKVNNTIDYTISTMKVMDGRGAKARIYFLK